MDTIKLATDLVHHLAPVLPTLVFAGTEAGKVVVKKATDAALEAGKNIWDKLKPHTAQQPALLDAAREVAAQTDDPDAQGALRLQVRKLLEAQPLLAEELEGVVKQIAFQQNTLSVSGPGAVGIVGNASGNTITTNVNQK